MNVFDIYLKQEDVAKALLLDREDAACLVIDLVGGDVPIEAGLDVVIKKGETGSQER